MVECKSTWPDPPKAARRIAAHANAARGDAIIWIVGLDEGGGRLCDVSDQEPADWWAQVEKRFADGVAPDVSIMSVPSQQGTVVALSFTTDRSPYLITTDGVGGINREIPWRAGASTRSARRPEVLSLLVANAQLPSAELIQGDLVGTYIQPGEDLYSGEPRRERGVLTLNGKIFLDGAERAMLPRHLWSLVVDVRGIQDPLVLALHFTPSLIPGGSGPTGWTREHAHPDGVAVHASGIYMNGPGALSVYATCDFNPDLADVVTVAKNLIARFSMGVSRSDRPLQFVHQFRHVSGLKDAANENGEREIGRWRLEDHERR